MDGVGKKNHLASKIPRLSPFFSIMIKNMAFLNFCQKKEGGGGYKHHIKCFMVETMTWLKCVTNDHGYATFVIRCH